jgi:hypothetical protein
MFYLKTETEFSLRNVVFLNENRAAFFIKTGRRIMSRNIIFVLVARKSYCAHKALNFFQICACEIMNSGCLNVSRN